MARAIENLFVRLMAPYAAEIGRLPPAAFRNLLNRF